MDYAYIYMYVYIYIYIYIYEWEHLAEDRLKWRSAIQTGGERLENQWLRKLALQRQRRSTND